MDLSTDMYKLERAKPFHSSLMALKVFAEIPTNFKKTTMFFFNIYSWLIKFLYFIFNLIAPLLHLIMCLRGRHNLDISEDLATTIGAFSALLMDCLFTLKWKEWSLLLQDISKETTFGIHPDTNKTIRRLNRWSACYTIYCSIIVANYGINAFLASSQCKQMNKNLGLHEICGVLTSIWLPFEEISAVASAIIFVLQLNLFLFAAVPSAIMCFLVWETAEILICHINNLKEYFMTVFDDSAREETIMRLHFCIMYHNHIIELGRRLSTIVKYTSGIMSILSAVALGCLGNQVLNKKPVGAILYLSGYLLALFWVCHAGQRIKDESIGVQDAIYGSKWYNAPVDIANETKLIIARCQKPICLEVLPCGILDYSLFVMIVKTAYSYLTLLSQTM